MHYNVKPYIIRFVTTFMCISLHYQGQGNFLGRVEYDMNNKWSSHHWYPIDIKYRVDYDLPFSEYQFVQYP